mmetsp:Transcript_787/g.1608  ORF Transcript_787/g.1608 Transcript_787/m.1608 type:complete len:96 (-) Transcript_787:188-475(-)
MRTSDCAEDREPDDADDDGSWIDGTDAAHSSLLLMRRPVERKVVRRCLRRRLRPGKSARGPRGTSRHEGLLGTEANGSTGGYLILSTGRTSYLAV